MILGWWLVFMNDRKQHDSTQDIHVIEHPEASTIEHGCH